MHSFGTHGRERNRSNDDIVGDSSRLTSVKNAGVRAKWELLL
jgi:hypothetical protein